MESGSYTGIFPPCSRTVASEVEEWADCFKQGGRFKWQDVLVWPSSRLSYAHPITSSPSATSVTVTTSRQSFPTRQ